MTIAASGTPVPSTRGKFGWNSLWRTIKVTLCGAIPLLAQYALESVVPNLHIPETAKGLITTAGGYALYKWQNNDNKQAVTQLEKHDMTAISIPELERLKNLSASNNANPNELK